MIHRYEGTCGACGHAWKLAPPERCRACGSLLRLGKRVLDAEQVRRIKSAAKGAGLEPESYGFVYAAFAQAAKDWENGRRGDVSARALCAAVRAVAVFRYGPQASAELARWGLLRSEDVGRVVDGLVEAGVLVRSGEAHAQEFAEIFELGDAWWRAVDEGRGRCWMCGYDLRGSPTGVCPECGFGGSEGDEG
jgi:uncharacterized repeat protein (TIGR04138 family)